MTADPHLRRLIEETRRLYGHEQLQMAHLMDPKKLARPSFSFLQDTVKELMLRTRILRDVFGPAEFAAKRGGAAATSDRPARVEFVQKLIGFVAKNKHPTQGCVASKVAAGLDPVKTNELLQNLARVALLKLNERQRTASLTTARPDRQPQAQQQQQQQQPQPQRHPSPANRKRSAGRKESPSSRRSPLEDPNAKEVSNPSQASDSIGERTSPDDKAAAQVHNVHTSSQREEDVELLRASLRNLQPKLERMAEMDGQLMERLHGSLAKLQL